jgi:predicted outer membrane repeat protein
VAVSSGGLVTPASASTLTVTNCNSSGAGSLADTFAAASSGDTIVFGLDCTGANRITLSSQLILLGETLTVDGTGHSITISGNDTNRIFRVDLPSALTLEHLTLTHGHAASGTNNGTGGAIWSEGQLTILDCAFSNNTAFTRGGAIVARSSGTLTVEDSTLDSNSAAISAGAILVEGTTQANISTTTFTNNSTVAGGALEVRENPEATVNRSTFTGNSASFGGAVAIENAGATLSVRNSTLTANGATASGGGVYALEGAVTLESDTLSENIASGHEGREIHAEPSPDAIVHVANTIVSGTSGTNCFGTITDRGNNLQFGDTTCGFTLTADPVLGALQNNGGPTRTMATGEGSAARNAGSATVCQNAGIGNVDQRGVSRRAGVRGVCDIGAYDTGVGPVSTSLSVFKRSAQRIVANGSSTATITVVGRDPGGVRVPYGGDTVSLNTSLGSLSSVTDQHDGSYTATLTSGLVRGTASVTGTVNAAAFSASIGVDLIPGPPSGARTTIRGNPSRITADGSSTSTITVRAIDANGNVIQAGGATVLLNTTLGSLGSVTDNGNGTYSATLTSATTAGKATISGTINGGAITATAKVDFLAGPPAGTTTLISRGSSSIPANGSSTATFTVVAKDQFGNELQVGGAAVVLQTTGGSLGTVTDLGNGRYRATLTSSLTPGRVDITGAINGQTIGHPTYIRFI